MSSIGARPAASQSDEKPGSALLCDGMIKSRAAGHSRTATSAAVVEINPSDTMGRRLRRAEVKPRKRRDVKSADLRHHIDGIVGVGMV